MKQRILIYFIPVLFILTGFTRCITEYVPKGVNQVGGILVVEGTITDGESIIRLTRSVGLLEELTGTEYVSDATLWIECNDGSRTPAAGHQHSGKYAIQVGDLDATKEYRLRIQIGNEEYESGYLSPLFSPEIDSLFWIKETPGDRVKISIATHDPNQQSHFYRWSYKENWEIRVSLIANTGMTLVDGVPTETEYDLTTPNHIYACWAKDSSKTLILGSTEKLAEYRIAQKDLVEISPSSECFSVLYHVAVEQMQLRKESYDYFYNLQKNIESGSSLFTPMPSELRGNIRNSHNPDERIIGYIEVASIARAERYIESSEVYERPRSACTVVTDAAEADSLGLELFFKAQYPGEEDQYSERRCFDCRTHPFATKNKPSWWRNEWPL